MIHYRSSLVGHTVVTSVDSGAFAVAADRRYVSLRDPAGRTVLIMPLTYRLDDVQHAVRTQVSSDGRTLEMTPEAPPKPASARPIAKPASAKPIASPAENGAAANDFNNTLGMGTTTGSLLGLALGVAVGFVIGVIGAGTSCAAISVGCAVAALPIVATVATVGGIIGTIALGGPVLILAALNYVQTLLSPPFTTPYWTHK